MSTATWPQPCRNISPINSDGAEFVSEVVVAWNRLPAAERPDCGIFAQDYGAAGAIDWYGPAYGLPPSLSGHQTWFLWGPRGYSGNCLIVLDDSRARLEQLFSDVEFVADFSR